MLPTCSRPSYWQVCSLRDMANTAWLLQLLLIQIISRELPCCNTIGAAGAQGQSYVPDGCASDGTNFAPLRVHRQSACLVRGWTRTGTGTAHTTRLTIPLYSPLHRLRGGSRTKSARPPLFPGIPDLSSMAGEQQETKEPQDSNEEWEGFCKFAADKGLPPPPKDRKDLPSARSKRSCLC